MNDEVRCDSCGETVPEEYTKTYVVGEVVEFNDWSIIGKLGYKFDVETVDKGKICAFCQEDTYFRAQRADHSISLDRLSFMGTINILLFIALLLVALGLML